jgi:hypothetical protein
MSVQTLNNILNTKILSEFKDATAKEWNLPIRELIKASGKGRTSRTMGHVSVAIFIAEQMSAEFHAKVIKTFIEGKILQFRDLGGTEFKALNAAINEYLPERENKSNTGVFIQVAKLIRAKIVPDNDSAGCWDTATVDQIHLRYSIENKLVDFLKYGFIKNYDHLKDIISKM